MLFVAGSQLLFVDELHAFFTSRQRQPDGVQRLLPQGQRGRRQAARSSQRLGEIKNQAGIHQHLAVVADQGRCFHHGVEGLELIKLPEHRHAAVLKTQSQQLQRYRHTANIGRVEHANELHGMFPAWL